MESSAHAVRSKEVSDALLADSRQPSESVRAPLPHLTFQPLVAPDKSRDIKPGESPYRFDIDFFCALFSVSNR